MDEEIVKCEECGSRDLKQDDFRAELYCKDCGLVLDEEQLEERHTGKEKPGDPHSERIYEPNREGYMLGSKVGVINTDGRYDNTKIGRAIRKAEQRSLKSHDRTIQKGIIQVHMLCGDLDSPPNLKDQAIWNYKNLFKANLLTGSAMDTRVAAIVYFTYKDNHINRRIEQFI